MHAKCTLNKQSVCRVILDPGSTHSLVEEACVVRLGLKESKVQLPGIESANGQQEPVHALGAPIRLSVEGVWEIPVIMHSTGCPLQIADM